MLTTEKDEVTEIFPSAAGAAFFVMPIQPVFLFGEENRLRA
jgi:hypothetical protein